MKVALITLVILLVIIIILILETKIIKEKIVTVKTNKIKGQFSIIFISDLHIGKYVKEKELIKIVSRISNLGGNVLLFGGDLFGVEIKKHYTKQSLKEILCKIKLKKYGVFGNHEYKTNKDLNKEEMNEWFESVFVKLHNKKINLTSEIDLIGLDFENAENKVQIDSSKFNVLLSHHPDRILDYKNIDLALGGHTHGGHINVPFINVDRNFFFKRGVNQYKCSKVIISNGLGYLDVIKLRFLAKRDMYKIIIKGDQSE